jgi:endonuclease III
MTRRSTAAQAQAAESPQVATSPATPARPKRNSKTIVNDDSLPTAPKSTRKRSRADVLKSEDVNELPHNLGSIPDLSYFKAEDDDGPPTKKTNKSRATSTKASPIKKEEVEDLVAKATTTSNTSLKKAKNTNYGLTPGKSPFPNWPHPTPEECKIVCDLLSTVHGEVKQPETIPAPSLTVTGCGEVPSVLDALIRTRLSAATSCGNSARAFAGLVHRFGVLEEGIGKGSVNWNKVRLADTKDVFEAIKAGGLADVKSKSIKEILQMVWEENQARRKSLASDGMAPGSTNEASEEKKVEIEKAEADVLSLDHLHLLPTEEAFNALTKYPGIGPKTASCVLLFCLRRPSFAVDTHVFRFCRWLGWVPPPGDPACLPPNSKGKLGKPNERTTYAHCEVRIPDDLKYPLHQLFIKHGKTCPRCRAITGENSEGWDKGCVIDHLVKRTGVRKGVGASPAKKAKGRAPKKSKGKTHSTDESDAESFDSSELKSEDEGSI